MKYLYFKDYKIQEPTTFYRFKNNLLITRRIVSHKNKIKTSNDVISLKKKIIGVHAHSMAHGCLVINFRNDIERVQN